MTETLRLDPSRVVWREVEGEVIALDLRRSLYLSINRSGTILWPLLERGTTSDEMVQRLAEEAGLLKSQASTEVEAFISSLRGHQLLGGGPQSR